MLRSLSEFPYNRFYGRYTMNPNDVKKYAGKHVKGLTEYGSPFEGKDCDKWVLSFEDFTQIEADDITSIGME